MVSDIKVIHVRDFLRVTVQGKLDLKGSKGAILEIANATSSHPHDILLDVRDAPSYLSLSEVSEVATEFIKLQVGAGRKTAVLTAPDRFGNAQFFAISARNMGALVQAFLSFEEAMDWISLTEETEQTGSTRSP